jgi:signal transduction histidine kinase
MILFSIKDTGIGIPVENQKSIFKEFTPVKNYIRKETATGLGLSISKKLIDLMKGEIWKVHFHFS